MRTRFVGLFLLCFAATTFAQVRSLSMRPRPEISGVSETTYWVKIVGSRQKVFKGDSRGMIEAIRVAEPTGAPSSSGKAMARQRSPFVVTKNQDAASPQIMKAMQTNELLPTVTLEYVRRDGSGRESVLRTITLTNAVISSVRQYDNGRRPLEDVSFTYEKYESRER